MRREVAATRGNIREKGSDFKTAADTSKNRHFVFLLFKKYVFFAIQCCKYGSIHIIYGIKLNFQHKILLPGHKMELPADTF